MAMERENVVVGLSGSKCGSEQKGNISDEQAIFG